MRSLDDLTAALDGLGIEWANEKFSSGQKPAPPYIVLEAGFEEAAYADNAAYARWMPYEVLLYTAQRDYSNEQRIAAALGAAEIDYTKAVTHFDGEGLIEADFTVYVTESERNTDNA
jgi:hypothetical protein